MNTRNYELSFWFSSLMSEGEVEPSFQDLIKIIETNNGQILTSQLPQLKPLSYPIKKETNGYFGYIQFSGDNINLDNLKQTLSNNNKILRYLLVKLPDKQFVAEKKSIKKERTIKQKTSAPTKILSEEKRNKISLEELDKKLSELLKEE